MKIARYTVVSVRYIDHCIKQNIQRPIQNTKENSYKAIYGETHDSDTGDEQLILYYEEDEA